MTNRNRIMLAIAGILVFTPLLSGCPSGHAPTSQKDCVAAGGHWQKGDSHHKPYCQPPRGGTW